MKLTKFFGGIALACTALLASCGSNANGLDQIKGNGELVVATNAAFAPFEYMEGTEFKGIDIDIIKGYADSIGVTLNVQNQEFDAALLAVSTNKADLAIAGITKNAKREETLSFTDPYFTASQVVIVKSDSAYASLTTEEATLSLLTTNKAKIGVQRGTTGEYYAKGDADWGYDGIADTTVTSYDNGAAAANALSNGQIDAVIIDQAPATIIASNYSNLTVLDVVLTEEEYAIACNKGNDSLVASINEYIATIKANGTFDSIVNKYYAE